MVDVEPLDRFLAEAGDSFARGALCADLLNLQKRRETTPLWSGFSSFSVVDSQHSRQIPTFRLKSRRTFALFCKFARFMGGISLITWGLGLFDVAIQCGAGPRNMQISSHEVSKFTYLLLGPGRIVSDNVNLRIILVDSDQILIIMLAVERALAYKIFATHRC